MTPAERLRGLRKPPQPSTLDGLRTRFARPALAVLVGIATALLVPQPIGLILGVVAAFTAYWALRHRESREVVRARRRAAEDMPFALDLLAACLTAGAPIGTAVSIVAKAVAGPLGDRLNAVADALRVGVDPAEAWRPVADIPGGSRLIAAAIRSSGSGAALARGFGRLAEELREAAALAAEAAAERAGVLVVIPLGLCFLPAFVLIGLVPVVVAVLGDVMPT